MRLTDKTTSVLKNFAAINKNILIHEGSTVRTVSPSKTVMAKAVLDDEFPREVCLYDLNRFLNTVGLFNEPDIELGDTSLTLTSGASQIRYSYANPELLVVAKQKDLTVSDYLTTVHIPAEVLLAVDRARKTLGLEEISIEAKDGQLWIKALDASGSTNDQFALQLGESNHTFKAVMEADNMELIPQSYNVSISPRGITHWKGNNLEYWIVLLANKSIFEKVENESFE